MRSRAHIRSHPLHPMLVVFPIAFFTGALVFDLVALAGGYAMLHFCAYYLSVAGAAGAIAAAVPGIIDFFGVVPPRSSARRRAIGHGTLNVAVLGLFIAAILLRREQFTLWVLLVEALAVSLLFVAGWMGGTLVHRNQIGIDHRYAEAGKWKEGWIRATQFPAEVARQDELGLNQMKLLHVNGRRIVLARDEQGYAAFDDRCTHKGAALSDGVMICGTVHCPWHGSQFRVRGGDCVAGPATASLRTYPVSEQDGKVYLDSVT